MKKTNPNPNHFLTVATVFLLVMGLSSCGDPANSKQSLSDYNYIEVVEDYGLFGKSKTIQEKEKEVFRAGNDTLAYLDAYQKFCVSLKVNQDLHKSLGEVTSKPIAFKLFNDRNEDVSNLSFISKDEKKKEIENLVFSMENSIQKAVDNNKKDGFLTGAVDIEKVKKLEKNFRIKKDEFSNANKKWYRPKSAPQYTNQNGIYCYFQVENDKPSNLRFRVQYYNDDWLFFNKVQFSIDGVAFDYIPLDTETDSGNGGYIWEWFDESLTGSDKELITALANAKSAKMKFVGRQYSDVKTVTNSQIKGIKETIELYNAMGGNY